MINWHRAIIPMMKRAQKNKSFAVIEIAIARLGRWVSSASEVIVLWVFWLQQADGKSQKVAVQTSSSASWCRALLSELTKAYPIGISQKALI